MEVHKDLPKFQMSIILTKTELMLNSPPKSTSKPNFMDGFICKCMLRYENLKNDQNHHFFDIVTLTFEQWPWNVNQIGTVTTNVHAKFENNPSGDI